MVKVAAPSPADIAARSGAQRGAGPAAPTPGPVLAGPSAAELGAQMEAVLAQIDQAQREDGSAFPSAATIEALSSAHQVLAAALNPEENHAGS